MHRDHTLKVLLLIVGDFTLLWAALLASLFLRYFPHQDWILIELHFLPFGALFIAWLFFFGAFGLYDIRFMKNSKLFLYRLLRAMAANTVLAIILFYFLLAYLSIEPRRNLIIIALVAAVFIFLWRFLFNALIGRTPTSRLIFFGITEEMILLADYLLKNRQLGQKPVAFIANGNSQPLHTLPIPNYVLDTHTIADIITDTRADIIVISQEIRENKTLTKILFQAIPYGIGVIEFTRLHEQVTGKVPLSLVEEVWFLENLVGISKPRYEFTKYIFDLALVFAAGIPALALLPFIATGILLSRPSDIKYFRERRARAGDGLIFFHQKRVGRNGKIFDFIKFRSQTLGAEKLGEQKELARDPRQYPFGKFLRKAYLDELPQIWNVLKGEMSFVGPRPERPEYVEMLKQKIPFYQMRLLVLPGITGWAQVNMENDASLEDAPEKMQYDLYYIKNRSFTLDLLIILRTISALLRRQGR